MKGVLLYELLQPGETVTAEHYRRQGTNLAELIEQKIPFNGQHGLLLSVCCVLSAFCSFLAMQSSTEVGRYAFKATPLQFQMASYWYYIRLKALAVIFALESVLSMCVLCILYFGIQCRYRTLAQFSQRPDIIIKTNYLS